MASQRQELAESRSATGEAFLPYGRQDIDADDIAAVAAVLRGDWLTTGPAVETFERDLAATVSAKEVVVCSNGTAALHLALLAMEAKAGATAVVPAITFLATTNAPRYVGMEVAFADVDPDSGLMTPDTFAAACAGAREPQVVLPVDFAGQTVDKPRIAALAASRGMTVIDDSSHAFGTSYADGSAWNAVGSCAHARAVIFSFHAVKNITMGEGGAVATNDVALAARLRRLRNHGMSRDPATFQTPHAFTAGRANPWYYEMDAPGFNYRATDIQCALGHSQLGKLATFRERRAAVVARYDELLKPLAPLVRPLAKVAGCRPFWHLYVVHVDFAAAGRARAAVIDALRQRGIGTQVHYIPVYQQPYYRQRYGEIRLPGAESYYAGALSLPLFAAMTPSDAERVVAALTQALDA